MQLKLIKLSYKLRKDTEKEKLRTLNQVVFKDPNGKKQQKIAWG